MSDWSRCGAKDEKDGREDGEDATDFATGWLGLGYRSLVGLKAMNDLIVGKWKDVTKRASC